MLDAVVARDSSPTVARLLSTAKGFPSQFVTGGYWLWGTGGYPLTPSLERLVFAVVPTL